MMVDPVLDQNRVSVVGPRRNRLGLGIAQREANNLTRAVPVDEAAEEAPPATANLENAGTVRQPGGFGEEVQLARLRHLQLFVSILPECAGVGHRSVEP